MPSDSDLVRVVRAAIVTSQPKFLRSRTVDVSVASMPAFFTDAEVAAHASSPTQPPTARSLRSSSASFVFFVVVRELEVDAVAEHARVEAALELRRALRLEVRVAERAGAQARRVRSR